MSERQEQGQGGALAVIIGRAGSKGLPGKNALILAGRPMICHTIEDALEAKSIDHVIVSTDGDDIASAAATMGAQVVRRPPELASDTATVDAAVRHAVQRFGHNGTGYGSPSRESHQEKIPRDLCPPLPDIIVILYANVPIRPDDLIDRAVDMLLTTGCDSVQSYCDVGRHHPYWMVSLEGNGRVMPHVQNTIYRRQDLPKLLIPDGGVIAVTRRSLLTVVEGQPHAFLGADRRGIENLPGVVIDIDSPIDLAVAESMLGPKSLVIR